MPQVVSLDLFHLTGEDATYTGAWGEWSYAPGTHSPEVIWSCDLGDTQIFAQLALGVDDFGWPVWRAACCNQGRIAARPATCALGEAHAWALRAIHEYAARPHAAPSPAPRKGALLINPRK